MKEWNEICDEVLKNNNAKKHKFLESKMKKELSVSVAGFT